MSLFSTLLFWAPIAFLFFVAASYAGTMLALKRYHEDAEFSASDFVRIEDRGDDGREN
jgi:hypothetical protein